MADHERITIDDDDSLNTGIGDAATILSGIARSPGSRAALADMTYDGGYRPGAAAMERALALLLDLGLIAEAEGSCAATADGARCVEAQRRGALSESTVPGWRARRTLFSVRALAIREGNDGLRRECERALMGDEAAAAAILAQVQS